MRDMAAKGRKKKGFKRQPGEANGASKLTNDQVLRIRALREEGLTYTNIAEKFGVDMTLVHLIVKRKIWKHV